MLPVSRARRCGLTRLTSHTSSGLEMKRLYINFNTKRSKLKIEDPPDLMSAHIGPNYRYATSILSIGLKIRRSFSLRPLDFRQAWLAGTSDCSTRVQSHGKITFSSARLDLLVDIYKVPHVCQPLPCSILTSHLVLSGFFIRQLPAQWTAIYADLLC